MPTATNTPAPTGGAMATPTPIGRNVSTPTPTVTGIPNNKPDPVLTATPVPTTVPATSVTPTVTGVPTSSVTPGPVPADDSGLEVTVSKQDIVGNEIPNAELTFRSVDGFDLSGITITQDGKSIPVKVSDDKTTISFITDDSDSSIISGLKPGTYELVETVTPAGYLTAEKITFELEADGSISYNGQVSVAGSQIAVIDNADPSYQPNVLGTKVVFASRNPNPAPDSNRNPEPIPATGEIINSITVFFALTLIAMSAGLFVICTHRSRKEE